MLAGIWGDKKEPVPPASMLVRSTSARLKIHGRGEDVHISSTQNPHPLSLDVAENIAWPSTESYKLAAADRPSPHSHGSIGSFQQSTRSPGGVRFELPLHLRERRVPRPRSQTPPWRSGRAARGERHAWLCGVGSGFKCESKGVRMRSNPRRVRQLERDCNRCDRCIDGCGHRGGRCGRSWRLIEALPWV